MKFQPKSEKQIAEEGLYPEGSYSFEISSAENKTSKSGNDMIQLKIKVYDNDGNFRFVDDYLLESMAYKLRHAAFVCDLGDKYEAGDLDAFDFVGKTGNLSLKIQKDKKGEYPDKNVVKDYIAPKDGEETIGQALQSDEVPW